MPTEMRLRRESIIILKNWLKVLLRLIREGDFYSNIYGRYEMTTTYNNFNEELNEVQYFYVILTIMFW